MFHTERSYDEQSPTSICKSVKICNDCRRFVKLKSRHECETAYCFIRPKLADRSGHRIIFASYALSDVKSLPRIRGKVRMVRRYRKKQHTDENESEGRANYKYKRDRVAFVFYDFETRQDKAYEETENIQIHVPTLCKTTNLRNMCGDRGYISAMSLVRSASLYFEMIRLNNLLIS